MIMGNLKKHSIKRYLILLHGIILKHLKNKISIKCPMRIKLFFKKNNSKTHSNLHCKFKNYFSS